MKKIILGLAVTLGLLSSFNAATAADDQYPAANFEPSVIYMDNEVVAQATHDDKYPAANFQPKVIYRNNDTVDSQDSEQYDPKYPAAYFKPTVIYP